MSIAESKEELEKEINILKTLIEQDTVVRFLVSLEEWKGKGMKI